ncbi:MAG: fibronectin type III domain-containing protein [Acidimicrobiia bacterium]
MKLNINRVFKELSKFSFISHAITKIKNVKSDRDEKSFNLLIIRSTALVLSVLLIGFLIFSGSSEAFSSTWHQTQWNGGVGSSTTNQYSSATGIDDSTSGQFSLSTQEKITNGSFDSNTNNWGHGLTEIAPELVASSIKTAATATTHSLTYASTPQVGNLLVATIGFNGNPGTVGVPTGWVKATESFINNSAILGRVAIYYKVVQSGDPSSFTVTNSTSTAVNFNIMELTGVDLTDPVDRTSTVNSGASSTTSTAIPNTLETRRAKAISVAGVVYESSSAFTSWSNSFINTNATAAYGYSASKVLSTKQQVSTTFTAVTARRNAGALVVFRGALTSQQNTIIPGVVQSKHYATEFSHALTLNSAPTVGNVLVAAVSYAGNPGTIRLPSGWVQSVSVTNTSSLGRVEIYHKVVQSGDPQTFVIYTSTASVVNYTLHELSGIDTSNPLDVTSSVQSAATTLATVNIPATATTSTANAIAIARVKFDNTSAYTSWSNGFSNVVATTNYGYTGTKILSSTQAVSTTFTGVTARRNAGAVAVYKAAPSATPAIVQTKVFTYNTSTALAVQYDYQPKKGNTLFATFNTRSNVGDVTAPSGWTQVAYSESASGRATYLYSKVATASESIDQFFNMQYSNSGSIAIYEVRGIYASSALDRLSTFANQSSNPITFSISAPTQNSAFILGAMGSSTTSGYPTAWSTNGFSTIFGVTASEFQSGHIIQSTASAYNLSFVNASARIVQGYLAAFKAGGNYVDLSTNTDIKRSGASSAKVVASPYTDARFTQSINVGDTETYTISTYVYSDGSAIDNSVAQLYFDGAAITTNYQSVGSGWYKLSADVGGRAENIDYGLEIKSSSTVYVDDFSVNRYSATGTLTSNVFDTERLSNWGALNYVTSGSGTVAVKARSSNDPNMLGAPNFSTCTAIVSGADMSSGTNGCVTDAERYVQYQVLLTRASGLSPVFEDITIDYVGADQTPPDSNASNIEMFKSDGGDSVSLNGWTNGNTPYFTWDSGVDNAGGIGVVGYCVYLGTDETADPITTKGMLGTGDLEVRSSCPYATANSHLDTSLPDVLSTQLTTSNTPYYLNIKAIDGNDNIYTGSAESFHFRFDNTAPTNPAFINAPSNFINTKHATLTWPTSGGSAAADSNSGIAGLQYRIGGSGTWYGDSHSGTQAFDDLLANDGSYDTQSSPDYADLIEGSNVIYFRSYDQAGNVSIGTVTTVLKVNTAGAPSAPQNLEATPSTNTTNSFAFSWIAPATFVGNENNLTYCYTINALPTVTNCTFTAAGVTSIPAGAYATQPGVNVIYVVARDESSSINYSTFATAEFTANTAAPGLPLNTDIADTSVRASSNWRLVISWETPDDVGAGIASYQVYRSTDQSAWSKAGSTSGSSYVDTSLSQVEYFYKVRACDSANNCGAYSSIISETPTGRYTTPPLLTTAGGSARVSDIQTRSAKFSWSTDRNADTKIAFGTTSGQYGSTEAYNSVQTTDHEIDIDNLTPGTTYYFVARWTDTDGNTGTTTEQVFSTLPPPTVEDVNAIEIALTSATVQYTTTGAAKVKVYYGQTSGFGAVIESSTSLTKSTYLTQLKNLLDGTKYFYKINTFDASGFEYDGTTLTFETPPAPKIINLRFQPVEGEKSSTQLITWETNVPATSELSYGILGGETLTALDTTLTLSHSIQIKDLVDDSNYSLVARSRDAKSNLATSDTQTFKTELDTRPPKVSDVIVSTSIRGVGGEARGQIIVSWKTDEPATSQVSYGEGTSGDVGSSTTQDGRLTLDHAVVISDLSTSKVYTVLPISYDKGQNKAVGDKQSAIIGRGSESALGIIFSVLQKIFGFGK